MKINLPPNEPNDRFFRDTLARFRPALTFRGFDNKEDHKYGYGLKQVIALGLKQHSIQHNIIHYLQREATHTPRASESIRYDAATLAVNRNSLAFQARSFLALLTLVLEENEMTLPGLRMISHSRAMKLLRTILLSNERKLPLYENELSAGLDRVKWTTALANMSRGLDLYLALENAYAYYGRDVALLLTREQKAKTIERHVSGIRAVLEVVDSGVGALISGNWSLKMWSAASYACLASQYIDETEARRLLSWFGRGLRRSGPGDPGEKRRYWTYMSSREKNGEMMDGQRTWAEGPYYLHFTLQDVVPLWHAVRAQGYLDAPEHNIRFSDPFNAAWFTEPLNWLADVTTPLGETPPFDDGNRRPMFNANLLTWAGLYGNGTVSRKMNWVFRSLSRAVEGIPTDWKKLNTDVLLVQLAMPQTMEADLPARLIGNHTIHERGEEQLIVRRKLSGKRHFVCLHGELDLTSIERGKGHEQPDQLQLLYYLDEQSVLMDAGYDRGFITKNSSWNRYTDNNVMAYAKGDSGMAAPHRFTKSVSHSPAEYLYVDEASTEKLYVLKGQTRLAWRKGRRLTGSGYRHETEGRYRRTVLFVADESHPYLIDVNQVWNDVLRGKTPRLCMRYHIGSNAYHGLMGAGWYAWTTDRRANAYLFFDSLAHPKIRGEISIDQVEVEERFRIKEKIKRFTFESAPAAAITTVGILYAGSRTPNTAPVAVPESERQEAETCQIWRWDHTAHDKVDFLLVRPFAQNKTPSLPARFDIAIDDKTVSFVSNGTQNVGFIRYKKIHGRWQAEDRCQFGLDPIGIF